MKKNIYLTLTFLTIILNSCAAKDNNSSSLESKTISKITIGTSSKIEKAIRDEYAYDMLASGVSEMPLISKNINGEFIACLANYEVIDANTYRYTIVDNLKWSDGIEVTANDILFSLKFEETTDNIIFSTDKEKGKYASYEISNDLKTITLILESPNIKALEDMTTFRIRPEHIYNKNAQVTIEDARVTCGPYKLDKFDKDANTLIFIKNEYYPFTINVEKVIYKIFSNDDVMYSSLINEDLDFVWNYATGVNSTYLDVLSNNSNITLESIPTANCPAMLTFNNKKGLASDKNIRFAIAYALDYEAFKKYFGSQYAKIPNRSFVPSTLFGYKETEKLTTNLEKANQYMLASNYQKVNKFYEKDGKVASFSLTVNSSKTTHIGYAEFVKTQLENFGIKVDLDIVDKTHYNEKTSHKFANEGSHLYKEITMEAAIFGYTAYGMSNLGGMYINGNHPVQGGAEVYSELLDTIMNNLENAKTLDEYLLSAHELQDFYAEELPSIALFLDNQVYAHLSKYTNFYLDANFGLNNIQTWSTITK